VVGFEEDEGVSLSRGEKGQDRCTEGHSDEKGLDQDGIQTEERADEDGI